MATLLLVTNGPAGMRFGTIELGRRLRAAGHEITVLADRSAEALVRHHGLGFLPLSPAGDGTGDAGWLRRWKERHARRDAALAASGARDLAGHLRSTRPDLVLLDGEMQEHVIAAATSDVPLVLMNTFCSIWRQAGSPPPHTEIQPGQGWRGSRFGIWLAWTAFLGRKKVRERMLWLKQAGCDRVSVLKMFARERGFSFRRDAEAGQWLIPRTYPAFPVISLHASEFDFAAEPPERVHYVGPQVLRERLDPPLGDADRDRLTTVLRTHGPRGAGRPLVYGGFGSYFTAEPGWVRCLFNAFRKRPDWSLILPLAGQALPPDLANHLPANIHVFDWLPQLEVLPHCDVAVVHGGINTIDECVLAGVPMLVCNGRETDMPGNQARVVHHGLGLAADAVRDTPEQILAALERLCTEPHFAAALRERGLAYAAYEDQRVAEGVIERLLRTT